MKLEHKSINSVSATKFKTKFKNNSNDEDVMNKL